LGDLLIGHTLVNELSDFPTLRHGVEFATRAQVAEELPRQSGVTELRNGRHEFVDALVVRRSLKWI
jgi:phytoene dehydrogenase-like protein